MGISGQFALGTVSALKAADTKVSLSMVYLILCDRLNVRFLHAINVLIERVSHALKLIV